MGQATYVLKSRDGYLKVPFKGSGSIFTTDNILDCMHFNSPAHAEGFLTSIFSLPENFPINSSIDFQHVSVVKATLNIVEELVHSG